MEILGGLALFGSFMNTNEEHKNNKKKSQKISRDRRNEDNIYNSNNSKRARKVSEGLAKDRSEKSRKVGKHRIIPKYYNSRRTRRNMTETEEHFSSSDSEFSDNESGFTVNSMMGNNSIDPTNPTQFIDLQDKICDNRKYERRTVKKQPDRNNFLSQFDSMAFDNPDQPSSFNAVSGNKGRNANVKRMEEERELALDGGYSNFGEADDLTYGVVPKDQMGHDNMVPFFRGAGGYGSDKFKERQRNSMHQRRMEMFTGSLNDPSYRPKTERKPLFSPAVGATNIYGNSVNTDYYEGRYIPGRERRGELPFQQQRVTPGLGLGAHENAHHGLHDLYRVLPKTTDELRTKDNPKLSYKGVIIPGMKGEKGPIMGRQVQRRPDRFKEWGTDRMVKSLGYIRAPTMHGQFDPKTMATVNRGTKDQQWYSAAGSNNKNTPNKFRGNFRRSRRQNFKQAGPRGVMLVEGLGARPDEKSFIPDPTQRSQSNKYIGPAGTSMQQHGHAFDVQTGVPDPTKRDLVKVRDRMGAVKGQDGGSGYVINYIDNMPKFTMRDVHGKSNRAGAGMAGSGKGHHYYDPTDTTKVNMRNVHNKYDRAGQAVSGGYEGHHSYNPNDMPDPTKRDVHNKYDRAGKGVNGGYEGHHTYNPNDMPDPTKRDIHNKYDRAGQAVSGGYEGHHTYNPNDMPDPTKRDIHNKYDRAGKGVKGGHNGHHAYNPNDIPDPTKRDIHNKYDRAGATIRGGHNGHHTYNPNDMPDPTKRDIHNKYDRNGVAIKGNHHGYHVYDLNDIPDPTKRDIHNKYDRSGAAVKGNHYGYHVYDLNDMPDPTKRDIHNRYDRNGVAIKGNHNGHHVYDTNNVPDPTKRDIHNKYDRSGAAVKGNHNGYHVYDINDVPDMTKRDIHNRYDRAGNAVSGNHAGHHVYDANDVPDMTKRDIHKSKRNAGGAGHAVDKPMAFDYVNSIPDPTRRDMHNSNRNAGGAGHDVDKPMAFDYVNAIPDPTRRDMHKSKRNAGGAGNDIEKPIAFDYVNAVPDITLREIQGKTKQTGPAYAHGKEEHRSRRDAYNMRVNTVKEKVAEGRAPTNSNYSKGPTIEFTQVELKDPIQINRSVVPDHIPNNYKHVPRQTHTGNVKYYVNDRILSHIEKNLDGNPFINNLVHRSI